MSRLLTNTTDLQEVLQTLQNKAAGTALPELTNEGSAPDLLSGEQLINGKGKVVTGTMPNNGTISSTMDGINIKSVNIPFGYTSGGTVSLTDDIDNEVDTQADLIFQITTALANKIEPEITYKEVEWSDNEDGIIEGSISGDYINDRIKIIKYYAFYACSNLTSVSFPACTSIGGCAFSNCTGLTSVSFPACTTIGNNAFFHCSNLLSVNFPVCTSINVYAFQYCYRLTSVSFPACKSIGGAAFAYCSRLTSVSFPVCTKIDVDAFRSCRNLSQFYLAGSSVPTLQNSNAFSSTPYTGYSASFSGMPYIYVPSSLITTYQSATNWAYFSSYFSAIEDAN